MLAEMETKYYHKFISYFDEYFINLWNNRAQTRFFNTLLRKGLDSDLYKSD